MSFFTLLVTQVNAIVEAVMAMMAYVPAYSERFNTPDADLECRSSDAVYFKIHTCNFKNTSGGTASSRFSSLPSTLECDTKRSRFTTPTVTLEEDSSTLELLFQFVYPQRQPDIANLEFDDLARLAEAVERYQIYPAMQICNIFMTKAIHSNPLAVLEYSVKHNYSSSRYEALKSVTLQDIAKSPETVTPNVLHTWLRFYAATTAIP